jgi:hypothetical protein
VTRPTPSGSTCAAPAEPSKNRSRPVSRAQGATEQQLAVCTGLRLAGLPLVQQRGDRYRGRDNVWWPGVLGKWEAATPPQGAGDANYVSVLGEADAYVAVNGLDFPEEPRARVLGAYPTCVPSPLSELELAAAGVTTILRATGYATDFGWLKVGAFDDSGRPRHQRGVSSEPGLYFLGLPWLSRRGSSDLRACVS